MKVGFGNGWHMHGKFLSLPELVTHFFDRVCPLAESIPEQLLWQGKTARFCFLFSQQIKLSHLKCKMFNFT